MSTQELATESAVELITLTIDGFEVSVPKGTLVIRAAEIRLHQTREVGRRAGACSGGHRRPNV